MNDDKKKYEEVDLRNLHARKKFLHDAIITLMTGDVDRLGNNSFFMDNFYNKGAPGEIRTGEPLRIECRINGVDVSFTDLVDQLSKDFDWCVIRAAKKLVEERLARFSNFFCRLEKDIKESFPEIRVADED